MLTYTQRHEIQQSKNSDLVRLLGLIALDFAIEFREKAKQFSTVDKSDPENPVSVNTDANQYKSQMLNLCNQVINNRDGKLLNNAMKVFITITGRSDYTYQQVEGASLEQWQNFIKSGNPAKSDNYEGIRLLFEHLAGVSKEGKSEYDSLK